MILNIYDTILIIDDRHQVSFTYQAMITRRSGINYVYKSTSQFMFVSQSSVNDQIEANFNKFYFVSI